MNLPWRQTHDQLSRVGHATAQFDALVLGKGLGIELQDKGQRVTAPGQPDVAEEFVGLVAAVHFQQRQFHFAAFGGTDQRPAQFMQKFCR